MRIEPAGVQPSVPQAATTKTSNRTDPSPVPVAAPGSVQEFALTGQVAALLANVRQDPDVRPDVVAVATARLAAGDFNTPQAAAAAAAAIAQTQPSPLE